MEMKNSPEPSMIPDDEIDLLDLARKFWKERKLAIKVFAAFTLIGLLVALFSSKEYTASSTMVPQLSNTQSKLGGLSGLAAIAGFNLNIGGSNDLSPKIYPQIVSSVPFQLELMNTPIQFERFDKPLSLYDYLTVYSKPSVFGLIRKYTLGLPGVILNAIKGTKQLSTISIKGDHPIKLTQKQTSVQKSLDKIINVIPNEKEGYITLSCIMPEAIAAASLAQCTQILLQKYITTFKIEKARANEEFIMGRYVEAKRNYEKAQMQLASFRDRNKFVSTSVAQAEIERLNGEFSLQYSVYSELAKQLEQAKIQVKEETPVFTIIEPVSVPTERSKPNRPMILAFWMFTGIIMSVGVVFGREFLLNLKKRWTEKSSI